MARKILLPLTACLLVAGLQAPLKADDKDKTLDALYQKLTSVLCGNKLDADSILILANPGTPLSQDFDPINNDNDADILNQMADVIPKANGCFIPNGAWTYSSIYKDILDNKQTPSPKPLSGAEADELAAAKKFVADNQAAWDDLNDKYQAANADWINAQQAKKAADAYFQDTLHDPTATRDDKKAANVAVGNAAAAMTTAGTAFQSASRKFDGPNKDMLSRYNTIAQYAARDGGAWWQSLSDKMLLAKKGDGYAASFFPAPATWSNKEAKDWTLFSFKAGDKSSSEKSSASAMSLSIGYHRGPVGVDLNASKNDFNADAAAAANDFAMSFELKRINIYRRWFNPAVGTNHAWKMPDRLSMGTISYGNAADNAGKNPPMPVYVTSMFLIRNLKVKTSWFSDHKSEFEHAMSFDGRVSVGPFSISGGYSKKDTGKEAKSEFGAGGVSCPGVQVIGYLGTIPPLQPSPDPRLWQ